MAKETENELSGEVISNSGGKVTFATDVISTIAGLAAADVKGVAGTTGGMADGIAELLGKKNLSKGIKVEVGEEEAAVDISVIVEYGYRIQDVATNIQKGIKNAIETMTGLHVVEVNVFVQGVYFPKPEPAVTVTEKETPEKEPEPPRVR